MLACMLFFCPRALRGWHCMVKSPRWICNVYFCLLVCDHRARLSIRHQHGQQTNECVLCEWVDVPFQREEHTHTAEADALIPCFPGFPDDHNLFCLLSFFSCRAVSLLLFNGFAWRMFSNILLLLSSLLVAWCPGLHMFSPGSFLLSVDIP